MRNYLLIAFLLGLSSSCFFDIAKGMEDNSTDELTLLPLSRPLYIVSLSKKDRPLTNSDLREKHPLTDVIHYGNLDKELYITEINSNILQYNPSLKKIKGVLEKLKHVAYNPGEKSKIEIDAMHHIFLATTSLLMGANGMPHEREYGKSLMKWYVIELYSPAHHTFDDILQKVSTHQDFNVSEFIQEFQEREQTLKRDLASKFYSLYIKHSCGALLPHNNK